MIKDVFKLSKCSPVPIFVSGIFKELIEKERVTGISFTEIRVV